VSKPIRCPFCSARMTLEPSKVVALGEISFWCRRCNATGKRKVPNKGPIYWAKTEAKLEELMDEDKE